MSIIVISKVSEDLQARTGTAFRNNALDTIKTTFEVELDTQLDLSIYVGVVKTGSTFSLTSGTWADLIAAFNGANIDFRLNKPGGGNPTISTTIVNVDGVDMTLTNDGGYADGGYTIGFFQITSAPEQFEFSVNLVPNAVGTGTLSLIDNETQRFSVVMNNSLTISGLTDTFVQLGNKSGGSQFPTKTIERVADAANGNKRYELIIIYKNWLCINDDPYFSSSAVGEYYDFNAFMINGDPSVLVNGTTFQNGDTGYQDENFNGKPNDYALVSITWADDSANVMDAFDYSQNSNFTITINSADFNLADVLNLKMFTIPNDATAYQNRPNPIENNLMLAVNPTLIAAATPTAVTGNLNDDGAGFNITGLNFAITAGVDVVVTGKVEPNAAFNTLFASRDIADRKYVIWVQCSDSTEGFKDANTVNVLAEYLDAEENIQPLGKLGTVSTIEMSDHNNDIYGGVPDPYLEDDALVNVEFTLPKDTVDNPWINLKMRMVAEKTNGDRFILEEEIYDLSTLLPNGVTGILPIDFTQNRGFKLPATSNKHDITVQLFPSLDTGGVFGVQVQYPFITRYESWLPMPQAPSDFLAANSQNWYPYSSSANWSLQFEMGIETANGEYIDDLPFTVHTYDDWGESPGSSFGITKTDLTVVTKPYSDEVTIITAYHEVDTETWSGNEWGVIHVRPENGAPQWLIGTVLLWSDLNNPLIPPSGGTEAGISVGTKIVAIEARFDPFNDIDLSGDVTFTSRISGSTTGGQKGNIYKETFSLAKNPKIPSIRGENTDEEDRGYEGCCDPSLVLADLGDTQRNKNDITSPRATGDSVVFNLTKDGVATTYVPTSVVFPSQADAWYASIEWRDVLNLDGIGNYSIDIVATVAGNVQPSFNWGKYTLKKYEIVDPTSGKTYYNGRYTARVLSQFNNVNDFEGIDYTGSFLLDSLRIFNGKFGYFNPNTEADFVEYLDGTNEPIKTEDFFEYELRVAGQTRCIISQLLTHVRGMTNCWMSSYNYDDFDYDDLSMKNVILSEGFVPEHKDGSRMINGTVKFRDKIYSKRSHFQDNRQTAEGSQPPNVCPTAIPTALVGMPVLKTGQVTSFRTGDDGDLEAGRASSFFVLDTASPFGTARFTDTLGGTTYADNIVIDWTTYSELLGTVMGYYVGDGTNRTWNNYIDWAVALSTGGFTSGWRPTNKKEWENLFTDNATRAINYAPFTTVGINIGTAVRFLWTGTTYFNNTLNAWRFDLAVWAPQNTAKTNLNNCVAVRDFTVTGTVLT